MILFHQTTYTYFHAKGLERYCRSQSALIGLVVLFVSEMGQIKGQRMEIASANACGCGRTEEWSRGHPFVVSQGSLRFRRTAHRARNVHCSCCLGISSASRPNSSSKHATVLMIRRKSHSTAYSLTADTLSAPYDSYRSETFPQP